MGHSQCCGFSSNFTHIKHFCEIFFMMYLMIMQSLEVFWNLIVGSMSMSLLTIIQVHFRIYYTIVIFLTGKVAFLIIKIVFAKANFIKKNLLKFSLWSSIAYTHLQWFKKSNPVHDPFKNRIVLKFVKISKKMKVIFVNIGKKKCKPDVVN